jgi:hypothetical protein
MEEEYEDTVEMTPELARLAAEEEARLAAAEEDDDDDDATDYESDSDEGADEFDSDSDEEADEEGEDEEDDDPDGSSDEPRREPAGKKKPQSKAQKRIKELAEKRREAEKQAFEAEMRALALEERLAALEKAKPAAAPAPSVTPAPRAEDFEYGEVDPKYIDAMVEHKLSTERAKFQREQEEAQERQTHEQRKAHYQARLAEVTEQGNKRFKDFDAIVNSTQFPGDVAVAVLDSDYGVDIAYYLAKNIGKLREVSLMDANQRAKVIGRLEERFSAHASAGKKRSKAPETPGRKAGKKRVANSQYGPDDQDEFDKVFYS